METGRGSLIRRLLVVTIATGAVMGTGATAGQSRAEQLLDEASACRNARPVDIGCVERALSRLRATREVDAQRRRLERELTDPPAAASSGRIDADETAPGVRTAPSIRDAGDSVSRRAKAPERCRFQRVADDPPGVCPPRDFTLLDRTNGANDARATE